MRWCDFLFSHEGQYLSAYGTEGITYTVDANGEFAGFTDLVLNNPSIEEEPRKILANFNYNSHWAFPQLGSKYFMSDYSKGLIEVWSDNEIDVYKRQRPSSS